MVYCIHFQYFRSKETKNYKRKSKSDLYQGLSNAYSISISDFVNYTKKLVKESGSGFPNEYKKKKTVSWFPRVTSFEVLPFKKLHAQFPTVYTFKYVSEEDIGVVLKSVKFCEFLFVFLLQKSKLLQTEFYRAISSTLLISKRLLGGWIKIMLIVPFRHSIFSCLNSSLDKETKFH